MTDELEGLKRRLVVGHKRDGRAVYDETAKSELVALCLQPGASVSRLARECGVNANQVSRWLREHGHGRRSRKAVTSCRHHRRSWRYPYWQHRGRRAMVTTARPP
jgi:transposase